MKRAFQRGARNVEDRTLLAVRSVSGASRPAVSPSDQRCAGQSHTGRTPTAWSRCRPALLLALLQLGSPGPAAQAETNASTQGSPRFELAAFQIISERNIFNPNRSARGGDMPPSSSREPERTAPTESFALLGTMSYEKGRFAFFDGSSSDYRKVLQPAETIAGFKIADVAPTCVKLEGTNGRTIELCVGMQLSKRYEEDWQIREPTDTPTSAGSSSAGSSSVGAPESEDALKRLLQRRELDGGTVEPPAAPPAPAKPEIAPTSSTETDEVVRRLLQKREQELNK